MPHGISDLIRDSLSITRERHKLLEYYMVKPHGQLVPVSCAHYCASTSGLSTLSSSRALQENQVLGEISS